MLHTEKKTLKNFLFLYSFLALLLLSLIAILYYSFQKNSMLLEKRVILQEYSNMLIYDLKQLHINFDRHRKYPRYKNFNSAIYDSDRKLIFSTLRENRVDLDRVIYKSGKYIHYINEPESYYLGAKYVIVEEVDDGIWLQRVKREIFLVGISIFLVMLVVGYFLLRLFLKPMRDSLILLDRFIKDTTHELNTPISAIMANIEMIDKSSLDEKLIKKIDRIDIASRTISNLYQDLTYLILNNRVISENENVNLSNLIEERIEYFKIIAKVKRVNISLIKDENVYIYIDRKKISKLLDNLISNAIKYNKIGGEIKITLKKNFISIEDSGVGIKKDKIKYMFDRYMRFNSSVGGFGIGLSIVAMIVREYSLHIKIDSELKRGTKVTITW